MCSQYREPMSRTGGTLQVFAKLCDHLSAVDGNWFLFMCEHQQELATTKQSSCQCRTGDPATRATDISKIQMDEIATLSPSTTDHA
jgi:hypothetical protein